jgi:predicted PurR-regulated permease PerM
VELPASKRAIIWAAATAALFLFVWYAHQLILLAFTGLLLAILLRTVSDWLGKHLALGPKLAFALTIGGLLALIVLTAWRLAPRAISQAGEVAQTIPQSLGRMAASLNQSEWGRFLVRIVNHVAAGSHLGPRLAAFTASLLDGVTGLIVIVVVGFLGALDPDLYRNGLLLLVPVKHRAKAQQVVSEVVYTLRWWLLGQLIPMVVLGAATMVGLWLLGIPLAFTLGLFTALMIFVPYVGALISEIPAFLVALNQSPRTAIYVIVLYLSLHVVEGYLLTPLVQKRAVHLPPVLTILMQFLLWNIAGLLGVAVATPLAAAGLILVKMLYLDEEPQY